MTIATKEATMLQFICPKCQRETLIAERSDNVTVVVTIQSVSHAGDLDYKPDSAFYFGGDLLGYECDECSEDIVDETGEKITNSEALAEWLRRQPYNASDELRVPEEGLPTHQCLSCGLLFDAWYHRNPAGTCPACGSDDLVGLPENRDITLESPVSSSNPVAESSPLPQAPAGEELPFTDPPEGEPS